MNEQDRALKADIENAVSQWPHPYLLVLGDRTGGHSAIAWPAREPDMVRSQVEFAHILLSQALHGWTDG